MRRIRIDRPKIRPEWPWLGVRALDSGTQRSSVTKLWPERGHPIERPKAAEGRNDAMSELRFMVPGITCRHCADAVSAQISRVFGVEDMRVDSGTRWVMVWGQELDIEAIRTAVDETGHSAAL